MNLRAPARWEIGPRDTASDADATEEDALPTIDATKDVIKPPPLGCLDAGWHGVDDERL